MAARHSPESAGRQPVLISVHIPKTGGTSFRTLLERHFGDRLRYDYDDFPMAQRSPLPQLRALVHIPRARAQLQQYACVHGHFLACKYRFITPARRAIWLRDPIDRLISRYYHYRRDVAQGIHLTPQYQRFIQRPDLTLAQFARIRQFHNVYTRFLWGERLSRFDFVGITEQFAPSLRVFGCLFDIAVDMCAVNVNPDHQVATAYDVPNHLMGYLRRVHAADLRLYETALQCHTRQLAACTLSAAC